MANPFYWEPGHMCACILAVIKICATTSVPICTVLTFLFPFFFVHHQVNPSSTYPSTFAADICHIGKLKSIHCCLFLQRQACEGKSILLGTRIYVCMHPCSHKNLRHHFCSYLHCFKSSFSFLHRLSSVKSFFDIPLNICHSLTVCGSLPGPLLNIVTTTIFLKDPSFVTSGIFD